MPVLTLPPGPSFFERHGLPDGPRRRIAAGGIRRRPAESAPREDNRPDGAAAGASLMFLDGRGRIDKLYPIERGRFQDVFETRTETIVHTTVLTHTGPGFVRLDDLIETEEETIVYQVLVGRTYRARYLCFHPMAAGSVPALRALFGDGQLWFDNLSATPSALPSLIVHAIYDGAPDQDSLPPLPDRIESAPLTQRVSGNSISATLQPNANYTGRATVGTTVDAAAATTVPEPAYRGYVIVDIEYDTMEVGGVAELSAVFDSVAPGAFEGQFGNAAGLRKLTFVGNDFDGPPYDENPEDWTDPPEYGTYLWGTYPPMIDPRSGARYAVAYENWLDTAQPVARLDTSSGEWVSVVERNDFTVAEADWDNFYLKGPSGRFYWRYGSELCAAVLRDSGAMVLVLYGEDSSPSRDSIAVVDIDSGAILAESLYTFPGGAAGFTDNTSTPKVLDWTYDGEYYWFMYYAGLGEDDFVVARWKPGDTEIELVNTLAYLNQPYDRVSADPDDPGSFFFHLADGAIYRYDVTANAVSLVVSAGAAGTNLNLCAYRKPAGASTGFLVTWSRAIAEYRVFNASTGALVATVANDADVAPSVNQQFDFSHSGPSVERAVVPVYYDNTAGAGQLDVITVLSSGALDVVSRSDWPDGWPTAGNFEYWTFDPGTGALLLLDRATASERPWIAYLGGTGGGAIVPVDGDVHTFVDLAA